MPRAKKKDGKPGGGCFHGAFVEKVVKMLGLKGLALNGTSLLEFEVMEVGGTSHGGALAAAFGARGEVL